MKGKRISITSPSMMRMWGWCLDDVGSGPFESIIGQRSATIHSSGEGGGVGENGCATGDWWKVRCVGTVFCMGYYWIEYYWIETELLWIIFCDSHLYYCPHPSNATGKLPHFCHVKHRLEEILPRWHQLGDRAFVQHNNGEIKQIAMRSRRIIANKWTKKSF